MMKANYHTHTARCGHAEGTDEEYVLAAIERGFDELGFSDHVPWPYKNGYVHPTVRMHISQMPEYLASVRALAEKYRGQIRILTGFECEYFPDYMGWLADMKAENGLDYLILGNHYDHDDEHGFYFGHTRTAEQIRRYVDSAVKGMETGMFAYLAHPDLFMRDYGQAAGRGRPRGCEGALSGLQGAEHADGIQPARPFSFADYAQKELSRRGFL